MDYKNYEKYFAGWGALSYFSLTLDWVRFGVKT